MPKKETRRIDTSKWKAQGFIPASAFARALDVPPITAHRWMDAGKLKFQAEFSPSGWGEHKFRFIKVAEAVRFVRARYSDANVRAGILKKLYEALK